MDGKSKQTKDNIINENENATTSLLIRKEIGANKPIHFTALNEFYYVESGKATFTIGQNNVVAETSSVVFIPSLMPYSYVADKDTHVWRFCISERYFADFYECYPNKSLSNYLSDKSVNEKIYRYVFDEFNNRNLTELEKIAVTNYVLGKFTAHYGVIEKEIYGDSQVADIIRYIYNNFEKDITLDSLAKEFCASKMVLSRKISKYIGVDLRKFISDVRVQAYMKMRNDKRYASVSSVELAYRCGFNSYGTFYRAYKRRIGVAQE